MRYITKSEANEIILNICQSYGVDATLEDDDDYYSGAEKDSDVATYTPYVIDDSDTGTEKLKFSGRIRVMSNDMTSDDLLYYSEKCKQVALCIQELNFVFKDILVKTED